MLCLVSSLLSSLPLVLNIALECLPEESLKVLGKPIRIPTSHAANLLGRVRHPQDCFHGRALIAAVSL